MLSATMISLSVLFGDVTTCCLFGQSVMHEGWYRRPVALAAWYSELSVDTADVMILRARMTLACCAKALDRLY
jgi:hypothetical protein